MIVAADKPRQKPICLRKERAQRKFNFEFIERDYASQLLIHLPFSVILKGTEIHRFRGADDHKGLQSEIIQKLFELEEIRMIDIEIGYYSIVLIKRAKPKVIWCAELMDRIEAILLPFIKTK